MTVDHNSDDENQFILDSGASKQMIISSVWMKTQTIAEKRHIAKGNSTAVR